MNEEKLKEIYVSLERVKLDKDGRERMLPVSILVDVLEALLEVPKTE
jgi:hypothetical protein